MSRSTYVPLSVSPAQHGSWPQMGTPTLPAGEGKIGGTLVHPHPHKSFLMDSGNFPSFFISCHTQYKSVQRCLHPSLVADSGAGTIGDTSLYLPESLSIFIWKKQPASYLEQVLPESTEFRWGCSSQLTPPSWLVVHSQAVATHTHSACCWSY